MKSSTLSLGKHLAAVFVSTSLVFSSVASACTSFLLPTAEGGYIYGRSLAFGIDLESQGVAIGRGTMLKGTGLDGKAGSGRQWQAKYAAIGASGLGLSIMMDGFNEKGLAGGLLYAPKISEYQTITPAESAESIASYEMLLYALTNFANVNEVKEGFRKIKVNQSPHKFFKGVVPVHMTLHDASGKSIVIEYIGGELQIHDNPTGVLTNAPQFTWHLNNLGNYANLSTGNPAPIAVGDVNFAPPSTGVGMMGLPGDYSSPSRFVRAFFMAQNAPRKQDATQQVANAFHILNNFDIAPGMISANGDNYEKTAWVSVSDIKNKVFYIRTFGNPTVHTIRMADINLDLPGIKTYNLDTPWIVNVLSD